MAAPRPVWQIVKRLAGHPSFEVMATVKGPDALTVLKKWHSSRPDQDAYELKDGAGYLEGQGVVIQAVPEGWLDADTGLPVS